MTPEEIDAFLAASRLAHGSGRAFAADFQTMLDALARMAGPPPDRIAMQALQDERRAGNEAFVEAIKKLTAELTLLREQIGRNGGIPERLQA